MKSLQHAGGSQGLQCRQEVLLSLMVGRFRAITGGLGKPEALLAFLMVWTLEEYTVEEAQAGHSAG